MRWFVLAVMAYAVFGGPASARAQTRAPGSRTPASTSASAAIEQATARRREGDIEGALRILRRALERPPKPPRARARLHFELGLIYVFADKAALVRGSFADALRADPTLRVDAKRHKPAVIEAFRQVRGRLRGTLAVRGTGKLALTVDGRAAGQLPYSATLAIGRHEIAARADGRVVFRRSVLIHADKTETITVPAALTRPTARAPRSFWSRHRWSLIAAGVGIAASAVAVGAGAAALSPHGEADDRVAALGAAAIRDPRVLELRDRVDARRTAANIAWAVAGVAAVTAIVLFIVEGRTGREQPSPRVLSWSF